MNYGKLAANTPKTEKKGRGPGKPWPKGVSGNPKGRPKTKPITDIFRELFDSPEDRQQIKDNIAKTLKSKGMAGVILLERAADRLEGKVPDELEVRDLRELTDEEIDERLELDRTRDQYPAVRSNRVECRRGRREFGHL